jgi:DNA-binding winged helix-turn-helix (wHTH) protein
MAHLGAPACALDGSKSEFSLDRQNQQLWCGSTPTNVPPKVFQLLLYLRDNPGRIIEYDELLDAVWPTDAVQPEILRTYIKTIRRLLDDDPQHPTFIETRTRRGYCFIGKLPDRCNDASVPAERLIGREDALEALRRSFGTASSGHRQVVFLVGEAGIGKTSLLDEFVKWSAEQDAIACRIECSSGQHGDTSCLAIDDLALELERQVRRMPAPDEGTRPSTSADDVPQRTTLPNNVLRSIEALATQRRVLIAIEDIQWADAWLLAAISRLARGRSPARLMVVATHRAATSPRAQTPARAMMLDLLVHGAAQELRLPQLSADAIRRYVLSHATVPIPRGSIEAITTYSVGNPLIMTTLVDRMVEEIRATGTSNLVDMLSRREFEGEFLAHVVPRIIRQSLELQLGQVGEQARRALESGSTAGHSFCAWSVAKVLDVEQVYIEELCRDMCGSDQILREAGVYHFPDGSGSPIYAFRNPLYASLLLSSQSPARREQIQQRFIRAVEECWGGGIGSVASELTERFMLGRDWSRALHFAKLAVLTAKRKSSPNTASLLDRGLSITSYLPEPLRVSEKDFFMRQLSDLGAGLR